MNIKNEAYKIHSKFGVSELANYKIQLLCEEYHEQELNNANRETLIAYELKMRCGSDAQAEAMVDSYLAVRS